MVKTLEKHKEGILAYYDERISSGKVEGVNNRIKTMIKSAYGYRDIEFFLLKRVCIVYFKSYSLKNLRAAYKQADR